MIVKSQHYIKNLNKETFLLKRSKDQYISGSVKLLLSIFQLVVVVLNKQWWRDNWYIIIIYYCKKQSYKEK